VQRRRTGVFRRQRIAKSARRDGDDDVVVVVVGGVGVGVGVDARSAESASHGAAREATASRATVA